MYKPTATVTRQTDPADSQGNRRTSIYVNVVWTGGPLDRPNVGGWSFPDTTTGRKTANRLAAAINAGKVFKDAKLATDVNGKTYICAETTQFFHGRHMNSSLKAIGF